MAYSTIHDHPPRGAAHRLAGSSRRSLSAVSMLVVALSLAACASQPELVPAPDAERVSPGGTIARSSAAGVSITVDPQAWRGEARIDSAVTPMHVRIENESDDKLRIRYSDFAMVAADGERYAALPPYDIRGSVAGPVPAHAYSPVDPLRFTYDGFHVAPFYRFMYPGMSVWDAQRLYFDPLYYERHYPYWERTRIELPTPEMLRSGLPEGVLDQGGVLAGFLYFERIDPEDSPVTFQADVVDVLSDEVIATLEVPFVMEQNEDSMEK